MPRPTLGRRRAYGQHFLKDRAICEKIAEAAISIAAQTGSKALLEIGPGKGAITEPLLSSLGQRQLTLCEKDRRLAAHWSERASEDSRLEILDMDFLALEPAQWLQRPPLTVVSNLPYSSGTAIFTRLARHPREITGMVLMFQAEVAHRLRAEKSTKDWGSLSLWTQNLWDIQKLVQVPPGAFSPPPQVQSEVVVLRPRTEPRIPGTFGDMTGSGEKIWESLLKACFQHRRKMLRAGLPKTGPLRNALELSGVDDTKRAEALDWSDWEKLFWRLSASLERENSQSPAVP